MIIIKNEAFKQAVLDNSSTPGRIALKAGGSPPVIEKLLTNKTDFTLTAAHKITDYLDFDIVVEIVPRSAPTVS